MTGERASPGVTVRQSAATPTIIARLCKFESVRMTRSRVLHVTGRLPQILPKTVWLTIHGEPDRGQINSTSSAQAASRGAADHALGQCCRNNPYDWQRLE